MNVGGRSDLDLTGWIKTVYLPFGRSERRVREGVFRFNAADIFRNEFEKNAVETARLVLWSFAPATHLGRAIMHERFLPSRCDNEKNLTHPESPFDFSAPTTAFVVFFPEIPLYVRHAVTDKTKKRPIRPNLYRSDCRFSATNGRKFNKRPDTLPPLPPFCARCPAAIIACDRNVKYTFRNETAVRNRVKRSGSAIAWWRRMLRGEEGKQGRRMEMAVSKLRDLYDSPVLVAIVKHTHSSRSLLSKLDPQNNTRTVRHYGRTGIYTS